MTNAVDTNFYTERMRGIVCREPVVVLIAGHAGAGKDTAAQIVENRLSDKSFVRVGIADEIKQCLLDVNPPVTPTDNLIDIVASDGWDTAHRLPVVRAMMERLGAWGRNLDQRFWLDIAIRRTTEAIAAGYSVIVPDVRRIGELVSFSRELETTATVLAFHVAGRSKPCSQDEAEALSWALDNSGTVEDLEEQIGLALDALL